MTPYYQDSLVKLYHGDCRELIPSIAYVSGLDTSVPIDCVITDPPYNVRSRDIVLDGRSPMKRDFGVWDEGWSAAEFLGQIEPVLRSGGSVLSFTSDRLLSEFRTFDGLNPRGTIVWEKLNPAPHPRPSYVSATEWIVWLVKPGRAAVWNWGGYTPNILRHAICSGNDRTEHPTQKPEALLLELIEGHTNAGELILDPYTGSGTTGVAAKRLGRKFIGIEISEAYCEIAASRLAQGSLSEMFQ